MSSKSNPIFIKAVFFLLVLIGFFALTLYSERAPQLSSGREIVLEKNGFEPRELVIAEGDTVTFRTMLEEDFWPASDSHPTHSIYSEFDSRKSLSATSTWSFVFTEAGTWGFHDHLASQYEGKIIVLTKDGKEVSDTCSKDSADQKCLEEKVLKMLDKNGIEAAFDTMAELYERYPEFRGPCHATAHSLGAESYELFKKGRLDGLSPKAPYCGYGFYHGFMEKMLADTGSVEEAEAFCKEAGRILIKDTVDAEGACYHGIGHGIVDGADPTLWGDVRAMIAPGIKMCEKITPTETFKGNRYRCVTGVYNSIEILSQDSKYGLDSIKNDPFFICGTQKDSYKEGCYTNMLPALFRKAGGSIEAMLIDIEKLPKGTKADPIRSMVLSSLMHDYVRTDFQSQTFPKRGVDICRSIGEDLRISCVEGISGGFMKYGEPQKEYVAAFQFCASDVLLPDESNACFHYIFPRLRIWYSEDKISLICKTVDSRYRAFCDPRYRI